MLPNTETHRTHNAEQILRYSIDDLHSQATKALDEATILLTRTVVGDNSLTTQKEAYDRARGKADGLLDAMTSLQARYQEEFGTWYIPISED